MLAMAEELGGTLSIRRSRSGGVILRMDTPLSQLRQSEADSRPLAQGHDGDA